MKSCDLTDAVDIGTKPRDASRRSSESIPSPCEIRRSIPQSRRGCETVAKARREVADILAGKDAKRLIVVCGPCSVDEVDAALFYAERLQRLAEEVQDQMVIVMRTYFEKPRSVVGWKGMVYDSSMSEVGNPISGIAAARRLAVCINDSGLPCATEFLNPLLALFMEDCIAYGSIGSRTVESQIHRELASGLDLPIGMKNAMDGNLASALNAVKSAQEGHSIFGQDLDGKACLKQSGGNQSAHVILRGGSAGPNFAEAFVGKAVEGGIGLGVKRPVMIDCSHGNSEKDHRRQPAVAEEVFRQFKKGQSGIAGLLLESYLEEGRQDLREGHGHCFGQSITDACMGWSDTECLIRKLAAGF